MNNAAHANGAWFSANDPLALPFCLPHGGVIKQLGWLNGSTAAGGVDLGVYDLSWNRRISTGAQTATGNVEWQWIDVADTALAPGRYYLAHVRDNATVNRVRNYGGSAANPLMALIGMQDSATDAYPLPDPLTNMATAATATLVPIVGIAFEVPF